MSDTDMDCSLGGTENRGTCIRCGLLPTINGRDETILMMPDGFLHSVCDDRWDRPSSPENVEETT